jgi:hypothetical protein
MCQRDPVKVLMKHTPTNTYDENLTRPMLLFMWPPFFWRANWSVMASSPPP